MSSLLLLRNLPRLSQLCSRRTYVGVVTSSQQPTAETSKSKEGQLEPTSIPETAEKVALLSGHPPEQLQTRRLRIYVSAKNAMQSGTYQRRKWRIEFDAQERWENPLMGWGSTADPNSNMTMPLEFASSEDAEAYCQRMGYNYFIDQPKDIAKRIKSYGGNFSWNKKTRRTAK